MRVYISFDVDVADLNESDIDNLLAEWTHEIRVSRRLNTWQINVDR